MKHEFLDKSIVDVNEIAYISNFNICSDRFYYFIYLKSGKEINQQLCIYTNYEKNIIENCSTYEIEHKPEDIKDSSFYRDFKYNYDRLLEKFND